MPVAVLPHETVSAAPDAASTAPPVIEVIDVAKTFDGRNVLDGVSLTVRRGETLVIMGASGCGKSTLLRCLIGAHSVDKGSVKLFGKDIAKLRQRDLDSVRKRYGILFQSGALFSSMTVGENVALPLKEHTKLGNDMIDLMVKVKLELVGLREAEDRLPSEISGGMAKRAGLARAIALDPELLFYDEPTSGLDPIMTGIIDSLITDLARTMSVTSVVVTHDLQSAFRVADRMVVLNNGRIVLQGLPHEIRASQDPFVRRFIHGPVESKTVMLPRSSADRGSFMPPPTGAALVSSGIRRGIPSATPIPTPPEAAAPSMAVMDVTVTAIPPDPAAPDAADETPTVLTPRKRTTNSDMLFLRRDAVEEIRKDRDASKASGVDHAIPSACIVPSADAVVLLPVEHAPEPPTGRGLDAVPPPSETPAVVPSAASEPA